MTVAMQTVSRERATTRQETVEIMSARRGRPNSCVEAKRAIISLARLYLRRHDALSPHLASDAAHFRADALVCRGCGSPCHGPGIQARAHRCGPDARGGDRARCSRDGRGGHGCRHCGRQAMARARHSIGVPRNGLAGAVGFGGFCVVWRAAVRHYGTAVARPLGEDRRSSDPGPGCPGGGNRLWGWPHRVLSFGRWLLRLADETAVGNELSEWHRADICSGAPNAPL